MPIFEYHCNDCTDEFEVLQRTSSVSTPPKCPSCGGLNSTKRFSAFATTGSQKETSSDNAT